MRCVIFGGADICDYSCVDVSDNAFVIAADRGYMHCQICGIKPDVTIGDFDSHNCPSPDGEWENITFSGTACRYKKTYLDGKETVLISAPSEKDDTDMMMAVKYALSHGCTELTVFGGSGGRFGHTMANIQAMTYALRNGCSTYIIGDSCEMTVLGSGGSFAKEDSSHAFEYVSLFSLSDTAELAADGMKYSGRVKLSRDFPLGVSNEFVSGKTGTVTVISGEVLIILEKSNIS